MVNFCGTLWVWSEFLWKSVGVVRIYVGVGGCGSFLWECMDVAILSAGVAGSGQGICLSGWASICLN